MKNTSDYWQERIVLIHHEESFVEMSLFANDTSLIRQILSASPWRVQQKLFFTRIWRMAGANFKPWMHINAQTTSITHVLLTCIYGHSIIIHSQHLQYISLCKISVFTRAMYNLIGVFVRH